ncbi:hypothetical protein FQZ97_1167860 [compost metagenome]
MGDPVGDADAKRRPVASVGFAYDALNALQADEESACLFEQLGTSGRKLKPTRLPGEEHHAHPLL